MKGNFFIKVLLLVVFCFGLAACAKNHSWSWWEPAQQEQAPAAPAPVHYRNADRLPEKYTRLRKRCVTNEITGEKVCGYDCKTVHGMTKCAKSSKQRCIVGPTGRIVCGYDCKATGMQAKCGKYIYDNCVSNSFGEIRCGNNCRARENGDLICGK
jgi:hypothetical protein